MSGMASNPPMKAVIIPVTPLQQNCTLIWCTETMKGAFTDPGGDLDHLLKVAAESGVTIEKLLVTHGHIDHCGLTGVLAERGCAETASPYAGSATVLRILSMIWSTSIPSAANSNPTVLNRPSTVLTRRATR